MHIAVAGNIGSGKTTLTGMLAKHYGWEALYESVEHLASKLLTTGKMLSKPICCNVDFYSGFVYSILGIPEQLYTPIFAIGRISGWCAHRIEELVNEGKIIRPAYKYVGHHRPYVPIEVRKPVP